MLFQNWSSEVYAARNEMVFQGRNKNYGAYRIRQEYNKTLSSIIISMIAFAAFSYVAKTIIDKFFVKPDDLKTANIGTNTIPPITKIITVDIAHTIVKKENVLHTQTQNIKSTNELTQNTKIVENANENRIIKTNEQSTGIIGNTDGTTKDALQGTNGENTATNNTNNIETNTVHNTADLDVMPEFPGGLEAMKKFIQTNLVIPQKAVEMGLKGKIYLNFIIDEQGNISKVEILKGLKECKECDEEAIRVLKMFPQWKPGIQAGHAVKVSYMLPINVSVK